MDFLVKVYKWLEKLIEPLRDFIFKYHKNPLFWIIIFVGSMLIFYSVYDQLRKEK